MEDQGVQSPQTFLVRNFFFLQPLRKHDDRRAYKKVMYPDRGFRVASWTKMVMYIISAKLNSMFGTIGKATAVKRQQKWLAETPSVTLAWRIICT